MKIITLFAALPTSLCAIGLYLAPWFGIDKQATVTPFYTFRHFDHLDNNSFGSTANILGAQMDFTWAPDLYYHLEGSLAHTSQMEWNMNQLKAYVAYRWLDDIVGDPITVITGVSVALHSSSSWKDLALYHNGEWEWEAHLGIGKECAYYDTWCTRFFGDFYVGIANRGSPWAGALLAGQYNLCEKHIFSLLTRGWLGFGSRNIEPIYLPQGYGSLKHYNIDIGAAYEFVTFCLGTFGAELYWTAYSYNYPRHPIEFSLFWTMAFFP